MTKYYSSISEWLIDYPSEPKDDILSAEVIYAFGDYAKTKPEIVDLFLKSFARTGHIEILENGRVKRNPWTNWEYIESKTVVNKQ